MQKDTQQDLATDKEFQAACRLIVEDLKSGIWEQVHRTVLHKEDAQSPKLKSSHLRKK